MNLSVAESESISLEADEICEIARLQRDKLMAADHGFKTMIDGKSFHCISSDKNIIFLVQGNNRWYLKYSIVEEWVRREIAGAEAAKSKLGSFKGYRHPKCIRASIDDKYTLYSSVTGKSFNYVSMRACLKGILELKRSDVQSMENLGRSLGLIHSYENNTKIEVLSPNNSSYISDYLKEIKTPTQIIEEISEWVKDSDMLVAPNAWIHGNIKSEDIFFEHESVSIIDFGTCGYGVGYEDLASLCSYLMLFRAVPLFPWRIARQAVSAIFRGYSQEHLFEINDMAYYLAQGVCRYYLKNCVLSSQMATISGMPVKKSQVENMLLQFLQKDYVEALEGVSI